MSDNDRDDDLEAQIRAALARRRPAQPVRPPQPVIVSAPTTVPGPATTGPAAPGSAPAANPAPAARVAPGLVPDPSERLGAPAPQPRERLQPGLPPGAGAAIQQRSTQVAPGSQGAAAAAPDGREAVNELLARSATQPADGETQIPPPPGQVLGRIGVEQKPAPAKEKEKPFRHPFFAGKRHLWPMLIIPAASISIVLVLFYFLNFELAGEGVVDIAPLIEADEGPIKVRPDEEGGMAIPNQDKEIFDEFDGETAAAPQVEQLVPPPEEPVVPEPALPSAPEAELQAGAAPATTDGSAAEPMQDAGGAQPVAATTEEGVPLPKPADLQLVSTDPAAAATAGATEPAAASSVTNDAETGAATEPAASAQTASLPPGTFRVQLAALRSEEAARSTWQELQSRLPELANLQLNVERIDLGGELGVFYRVQGGPLPDSQAAYDLCAGLTARGQDCIVVKP